MNKNASHLKIGTTLQNGKYTIEDVCGQGGFGITYKGQQKELGVAVAIKEFFVSELCSRDVESNSVCIISPSKVHLVESLRQKFHKEANGLFKLRHKNIVRTIDFFRENETIYYVMDYINGPSLNKYLKRCPKGILPEDKALDLFLQLCDALSYIHKKKMLHLDIKPDNILIDESGINVYLIDFGLSKQYDEINGENTSEIVGRTAGYSPIEQYENRIQHFEPATDIYALGATYYKMVTGRSPYTPSEILNDYKGQIPGIQHLNNVSRTIIQNCLKVTSSDRPQSIEQLLDILQKTGKDSIRQRIRKIFAKENVAFEPESVEVIVDETELVLPPLLEYVKQTDKTEKKDSERQTRTQGIHHTLCTKRSSANDAKRMRVMLSKKVYNYAIIGLAIVFCALYLYRFLDHKSETVAEGRQVQYALLVDVADSLIACDNIPDTDSAFSIVKQVQAMELSKSDLKKVMPVIHKLQEALFNSYEKFADTEKEAEAYEEAKSLYEKAKQNTTDETQLKRIDEKIQDVESYIF